MFREEFTGPNVLVHTIHTCCNSVVNLAINDMTGLVILTKKFTLLKILLQDRIWYPSWSNNLKKSLVNLPNHCTSQWVFWYSGKCFRGRNPIIFPSQVSAAALQTSHSTANEVSWSHLLQFRVLEERLRDSLGRRCWQMRGSATRCQWCAAVGALRNMEESGRVGRASSHHLDKGWPRQGHGAASA